MIEVQQVRETYWEIRLSGEQIGFMNLWGEAGDMQMAYQIAPEHCGRGYMRQALAHVVRTYHKPFKLVIFKTNRASIRVACGCGFLPVLDRGDKVEYRRF